MTMKRFAEAVRNNEPRYYVHVTTSRSLTRAFKCNKSAFTYGPYLLLSNAKRKARRLRKDRVLVLDLDSGESTDLGPSYSKVYIRTML